MQSVIQSILRFADNEVRYLVHLGDSNLVIGHRNSEWCGHGPMLEQDIAISNIALDQIGQARYFYQAAAVRINQTQEEFELTEDLLAFHRDATGFLNPVLTEQPVGDWACTTLRQCLYSNYLVLLYRELIQSAAGDLRAIAQKALKEVQYHTRWSNEWVIRLGDGTEESHARLVRALEQLWPFTTELFEPASYEPDLPDLHPEWLGMITKVFERATIHIPHLSRVSLADGKQGQHGQPLTELLQEMQTVPRADPAAQW